MAKPLGEGAPIEGSVAIYYSLISFGTRFPRKTMVRGRYDYGRSAAGCDIYGRIFGRCGRKHRAW